MAALVDVRAVHVYYASSHVLRGVDFRVATGETVGLLGRNGMGKTTLLRALLGQVVPRQGEIRLRGVDATGGRPERIARQGVAYVPEDRAIFPNLTARENCRAPRQQRRTGLDARARPRHVPEPRQETPAARRPALRR